MIFTAVLGVLLFGGGVWAAYWIGTQVNVSRFRRLQGIDKKTIRRYRAAAALLSDLEFAGDIDDQLTILPTRLSTRITEWNDEHRKAITG